MVVFDRKPVPIYELRCAECKSVIWYKAAINAVLLAKSDADITLVPGSFTNGFREGAKIKEDAILNALADVPAADVRPVVLCRDCKYIAHFTDGHLECRLLADFRPVPCTYLTMKDTDFCSYGKKRDAEPQKCDTCRHGAHWDGVVICDRDAQRHERTDGCERGEKA